MTEFVTETLEIARFCDPNCPVQCRKITKELLLHIVKKSQESSAKDLLMGDQTEATRLAEIISSQFANGKLNSEEIMVAFREIAAMSIDQLDNRIEGSEEERRHLGETCVRPLTVTAATENGQSFTIGLCTSPYAYGPDDRHVPTHVDRSFEL